MVLASLASAQVIDHYEPAHVRISSGAQKLTIHGSGLGGIVGCLFLVETESGPVPYDVAPRPTSTATELHLKLPPMVGGEAVVFLFPCAVTTTNIPCWPTALASLSILPPPPTVSAVQPVSVTHDMDTVVTLRGSDLDWVSSVYLEGEEGVIRCNGTTLTSATSLDFTVPMGCTPGTYRVRAIAKNSASFYDSQATTVRVTITEPVAAPLRVTNASVIFNLNLAPTSLVLTGPGLGAANGLQVDIDHPDDGLPPVSAQVGTVFDADNVMVTIPAGLPGGLYDFIATAPGYSAGPSDVKFIMFDNTFFDYLGNNTALHVNANTVALTAANFSGVVENGRLRFLYDFNLGRPLLSDTGDTRGKLGVAYDANPTQLVETVGAGATLQQITANVAAGGVDFHYSTNSNGSFIATWGIEQPTGAALTQSVSYTAAAGANPVQRVLLPAVGTLPGTRHLAAAQGGLALDANALAGVEHTWIGNGRGMSMFDQRSGGYDSPLCFLEDPQGGGVLIDTSALSGVVEHLYHHLPLDSPTYAEVALEARPGLSELSSGAFGPVRYVPTSSDWATAVESFEASMSNPHKPAWFDTLQHVMSVVAVEREAIVNAAEMVIAYNAVQDWRVFGLNDWRAAIAYAPSVEPAPLLPEWTTGRPFAKGISKLHARGFKVVPYLPTPGLGEQTSLFQTYQPHIIQTWDNTTHQLEGLWWDMGGDGGPFEPSEDYWAVNLSSAPYRAEWVSEVQVSRNATFPFEGVYFDFLDGKLRLDDRNPNNGNARQGFVDLCDEFRLAFNGEDKDNDFIMATEGQNDVLVSSGGSLGAISLNRAADAVLDPMGVHEILTHAHPIGAYLLRRNAKGFHNFRINAAGEQQFGMAQSAVNGYARGLLPTMAFHADALNRPWLKDPAATRASTQTIEEGLYRRIFDVQFKTDPDPLWAQSDTVALYTLSGTTMPITETWVVLKAVCDYYWWFGGRAPTTSELADLAGRTSCNAISLYAAMTEVREHFRLNPGVPITRSAFRASVQLVFPLYPLI